MKPEDIDLEYPALRSLPSRERGLKRKQLLDFLNSFKSLPSRERGLKLITKWIQLNQELVAPLAGAWIETSDLIRK